jgi:hypothetical protein
MTAPKNESETLTSTGLLQKPLSVLSNASAELETVADPVGLVHVPVNDPAYRHLPNAVTTSTVALLNVTTPFTKAMFAFGRNVAEITTPEQALIVAAVKEPEAPPATDDMLPLNPLRLQVDVPRGLLVTIVPLSDDL